MRVVIAGGHGQIALRLEKLLGERGDKAVGIIRKPEQTAYLEALKAEPVVLDLEKSDVDGVAAVLSGADAAIFAAGAGPGSGVERKATVDRAAAVLFAEAAEQAGVRRHIQVGSMGADRADEPGIDPVFAAYVRAKKAAEDDLRGRDLDWTILRPGSLTNGPGSGKVLLADSVGRGSVPRDDVAAVLVALLNEPKTIKRTLELISGDTPIDEAVKQV
jgi:uncharacterized protein YbjT (DUF2867 family)